MKPRPKREIPTTQKQKDEWRESKAKSRRRLKSCPKDTQTGQFDFDKPHKFPQALPNGGEHSIGFPLQEYRELALAYQNKRGGRILLEALNEIQRLRDVAALLNKEFLLE